MVNWSLVLISLFIIVLGINKAKKNRLNSLIEKLELLANNYYKIIILVLFVLTLFTTVFKLGDVPYGMHVDEAGMAYDAISIEKYGVDRYLNKFPVYLINYGGGQSAMYAYLAVLFIKLFGYSIYAIRMPAVLLRLITFISIIFLMKSEKNKLQTIIILFLFSIVPYFIMQSRWGLDCNLLVGFISIAICLLARAVCNSSNLLFFVSGIGFGLALYTYALSYLIIPLILLFTLIYLLYIKKIKFIQIIIFGIPIFILALPLILMILVNKEIIDEIKWFITIPRLGFYRGNEISFRNILPNLYIIRTIFSFDNPNVFGDRLLYNALPEFGTIYYISIPFFILGFIISIKRIWSLVINKEFSVNIIFLIWFMCVLICQLLIETPNVNKSNAIFVPMIYFVAVGIEYIMRNNKILILPILLIFILNFALFFNYYFYKYNDDSKKLYLFATDYLDAIKYSKSLKKENVYVSEGLTAEEYIYVFVENKISPYEFKRESSTINYDGCIINYYFNDADVDLNSVYIKNYDESVVKEFEKLGFTYKRFGNIVVFYSKNLETEASKGIN